MLPLFLCSFLVMTISLERTFFWLFRYKSSPTRGLLILETIASIAPVLGILGTILGIIKGFGVLSLQNSQELAALSQAMSEALITTATGLVIALASTLSFVFFQHQAQKDEN